MLLGEILKGVEERRNGRRGIFLKKVPFHGKFQFWSNPTEELQSEIHASDFALIWDKVLSLLIFSTS